MTLSAALDWLASVPPLVAALVLFASSMIEYLFPPFPGDTVTLAGAVLVPYAGVPLWLVFAAVTAGSLAGSMLVFFLGEWLYRWQTRRLHERGHHAFDALADRFRRHGAAYVAVNRFLPGVRSFFFVAAGVAGLPWWKVALWSLVSLTAWNALVVAAGLAVGANVARLEGLFRQYQSAVWAGLGVVAALLLLRWALRRRAKPAR